jgi:hypothetical protein
MSRVEIVAKDGTPLGEIDENAHTVELTEEGKKRMGGKKKATGGKKGSGATYPPKSAGKPGGGY